MLVDAYLIKEWESRENNYYDDFCEIIPCIRDSVDDWDSKCRTIWVITPAGVVRAEANDVIIVEDGKTYVYTKKIAEVIYGVPGA